MSGDLTLRWRTACIPARAQGLGLDRFRMLPHNRAAVQAANALIEDWSNRYAPDALPGDRSVLGRGLMLVGQPGSGKTSLACAVLTEIHLRYDVNIQFTPFADYTAARIEQMKWRDASDAESEERFWRIQRLLDRTADAPLVCLDDVGKEHRTTSGYAEDELDLLMRSRYRRGLPTVVTSNVPPEKWAGLYNPSMASFLLEAFDVVTITGVDVRRIRG